MDRNEHREMVLNPKLREIFREFIWWGYSVSEIEEMFKPQLAAAYRIMKDAKIEN